MSKRKKPLSADDPLRDLDRAFRFDPKNWIPWSEWASMNKRMRERGYVHCSNQAVLNTAVAAEIPIKLVAGYRYVPEWFHELAEGGVGITTIKRCRRNIKLRKATLMSVILRRQED